MEVVAISVFIDTQYLTGNCPIIRHKGEAMFCSHQRLVSCSIQGQYNIRGEYVLTSGRVSRGPGYYWVGDFLFYGGVVIVSVT